MKSKELNQLVAQIETHIECWKQFNHFISLARTKKFGPSDENHFLEIKSIIVQELEMILASVDVPSPTRSGTRFTSPGTQTSAKSRSNSRRRKQRRFGKNNAVPDVLLHDLLFSNWPVLVTNQFLCSIICKS
jgi:hypothetical protein